MTTARRILAPILLVLLIAGTALAIYLSNGQARRDAAQRRAASAIVTVHGLGGSEKHDYFADPRVLAELRKNGIDLQYETSGSREIAMRTDLKSFDFAFPAGQPAANKIMSVTGVKNSSTPFYTPMAVASWKPIAELLVAQGIVKHSADRYEIIDVKKLLALIDERKRWSELPHNTAYPVGKSILISSTDVRKSNSGAMYLSLASYVLNNSNIVENDTQERAVLPQVTQLFTRQGYQESTSAGPFDDYTTEGIGKAPLVMVYEAQFIEYLVEHAQARNPDMVLLYPQPTIYTKHTIVPFNAAGEKFAQLMSTDTELKHLAIEHGYRNDDTVYAQQFYKKNAIRVPQQLLDVVDPPNYDVLESMIRSIDHALAAP